jgi:hypothetical protein
MFTVQSDTHDDIHCAAELRFINAENPDNVLYEFRVNDNIVLVPRGQITGFTKGARDGGPRVVDPAARGVAESAAPGAIQIQNADSFTEFLFDKVIKFREANGGDPTGDPVYKFARRFYNDMGWPVNGKDKNDFREYVIGKLYNEIYEIPAADLVAALEAKGLENVLAGLVIKANLFSARLGEINHVLNLAWSDFEKARAHSTY